MINYIPFESNKIALERIYQSDLLKNNKPDYVFNCRKVQSVYGEYIIPNLPDNRPYSMGIFVSSVDGRIAFPESMDGSLIAKKNFLDSDGGFADYWTLNLIRAVSDAVLVSGLMLSREPDLVSVVYDEDLVKQRVQERRAEKPIQIIISNNGKNIPLEHKVLLDETIPVILTVSEIGVQYLVENLKLPYHLVDMKNESPEVLKDLTKKHHILILPIGKNKTNVKEMMESFFMLDIKMISIESPTFMLDLMKSEMLDELYQNTSGIYVGGNALSIGDNFPSFTLSDHPHLRLLSMHIHSDYFFYSRYKLIYGIKEK